MVRNDKDLTSHF